MSAWTLGRAATLRRSYPTSLTGASDTPLQSFVGRVIAWIPTDVVAIYTAATLALVDDPTEKAGKLLIIGGVALSLIAVPLGALSASHGGGWFTTRVKFRTGMAPIAFVIWSPAVPKSGWEAWRSVHQHPKYTVIVCAALAYVFAQVAQAIDNRVPEK
jgi:hypothetical protein